MPRLKKGTILVATQNIRSSIVGQSEMGSEFVYIGSYKGDYLVERYYKGNTTSHPAENGWFGYVILVKPCNVEVKT